MKYWSWGPGCSALGALPVFLVALLCYSPFVAQQADRAPLQEHDTVGSLPTRTQTDSNPAVHPSHLVALGKSISKT